MRVRVLHSADATHPPSRLVVCAACSRGRRPVAADASARVCDKCRCRFELVDRGVDVDLLICFIVQQCSMLADVDALKRLHVERIDTVGALRDDADVFVHLRPVPARPADVAVDVLDRARAGDLCASVRTPHARDDDLFLTHHALC